MRPTEASYTAEGSAFARAAGAQHPDPTLRNPDWMAQWMLGATFRRRALPGVWRVSQRVMEYLVPGSFFIHQARTRHFDMRVRAAVRAGARQVVLLGAGFDTRAYRLADLLDGVRVYEVDHPATSGLKQTRIAASLGAPPANVRYVAVDFARERVKDRLAGAGLDPGAPAFFLWEGVSCYLDRAAFDATLDLVAASGKGSTIAFDYLFADAIAHPERWPTMARNMRTVQRRGEPFTFGVEPGGLEGMVASRGLLLEENVMPDEIDRRYLLGRDGRLWGNVPAFYAMAYAERPG